MQHPMTYLTSLFQKPPPEPPLDARIVRTFAKWEAVQMATDDMHAKFEVMPLHDAEDLLRYQQMLADYAAYTVYAALMKQLLDLMQPYVEQLYGGGIATQWPPPHLMPRAE
jgi:hypothetical protein